MSGANTNDQGLDFDRMALERRTERVAKHGHEWWLRWDVPAEVLVQRLMLREITERTRAVQAEIETLSAAGGAGGGGVDAAASGAEATEAQIEALRARMVAEWDAYRGDVLSICHALFAHSYPEMSAAEVAEHFNTNEQRAIIEHFFTLPTRRSSPPPNAGSAAATSSTPATVPATNRATRRAGTAKPRR